MLKLTLCELFGYIKNKENSFNRNNYISTFSFEINVYLSRFLLLSFVFRIVYCRLLSKVSYILATTLYGYYFVHITGNAVLTSWMPKVILHFWLSSEKLPGSFTCWCLSVSLQAIGNFFFSAVCCCKVSTISSHASPLANVWWLYHFLVASH